MPQLRARVEGLEAEAAESAKMTYDATKLQQELETLKAENFELRDYSGSRTSMGLSRSASVAGGSYNRSRPPSMLGRSNTIKQTESREVLAERLKDVEAQRDALHSALKSLLERQEHQNRENEKKIKVLEVERDRLLSSSPKKAGYEREVSNLREEITYSAAAGRGCHRAEVPGRERAQRPENGSRPRRGRDRFFCEAC